MLHEQLWTVWFNPNSGLCNWSISSSKLRSYLPFTVFHVSCHRWRTHFQQASSLSLHQISPHGYLLLTASSPQQIFHLHLVLYSASSSVTSTTAMSSLTTMHKSHFRPSSFSSFLASRSSASFSQYTHHLSSIHAKPPRSCLSIVLTKPSQFCCPSDVLSPFLLLLTKIVTSSTLPPRSPPPPDFSSVPPSQTRTTMLVSLPPYIRSPLHSSRYSPVTNHSVWPWLSPFLIKNVYHFDHHWSGGRVGQGVDRRPMVRVPLR